MILFFSRKKQTGGLGILRVLLSAFVTIILCAALILPDASASAGKGTEDSPELSAREKAILQQYDAEERQNEIVFYGASNFRLWKEMEEDMLPYTVQNHGFGGSTDQDLLDKAEWLLYPYKPAIVVFQIASNDYVKFRGTDDQIYRQVIKRKIKMFETFHRKLPEAYFVVTNGILMPGRSKYAGIVRRVNRRMREFARKNDYLYFADGEGMTVDGKGRFLRKMFVSDGIHLTHEARMIWADEYIKPVLKQVIDDHPELEYLKKLQE